MATSNAVSFTVTAPPSAAWWRLNITAVNAALTTIAELEFRATPSGADQANGGTAIASTHFDTVNSPPSKAFDNNAGTAWITALIDAPPQWIRYHFLTQVSVQEISITVPAVAGAGAYAPKSWDVQYSSDGLAWTTLWTVSNQTGWGDGETRLFNAS